MTGAEIFQAAQGWIGTPFHHQAAVKGAGCDCLGLVRGVYTELGISVPKIDVNYPIFWAVNDGGQSMLNGLSQYCKKVEFCDAALGDIVAVKLKKNGPVQHMGFLGGDGKDRRFIHSHFNRGVENVSFDPFWAKLAVAVYRYF